MLEEVLLTGTSATVSSVSLPCTTSVRKGLVDTTVVAVVVLTPRASRNRLFDLT